MSLNNFLFKGVEFSNVPGSRGIVLDDFHCPKPFYGKKTTSTIAYSIQLLVKKIDNELNNMEKSNQIQNIAHLEEMIQQLPYSEIKVEFELRMRYLKSTNQKPSKKTEPQIEWEGTITKLNECKNISDTDSLLLSFNWIEYINIGKENRLVVAHYLFKNIQSGKQYKDTKEVKNAVFTKIKEIKMVLNEFSHTDSIDKIIMIINKLDVKEFNSLPESKKITLVSQIREEKKKKHYKSLVEIKKDIISAIHRQFVSVLSPIIKIGEEERAFVYFLNKKQKYSNEVYVFN